jgi:hypothetical protein
MRQLRQETIARIEYLQVYKGISIRFKRAENTVQVEQMNLRAGRIFSKNQLRKMTLEVFKYENLTELSIQTKLYFPKKTDLNLSWFNKKIKEYPVKIKNLIQRLKIKKEDMQLFLEGKQTPMYVCTLLFYYFYSVENNQISF